MRRTTIRITALAVGFASVLACSGEEPIEWNANTWPDISPAPGEPVVVDDEVSVRFGNDCGQLEVGEERSACVPYEAGSGQLSTVRTGDRRIVWHVWRSDAANDEISAAPIDHAIVWSNLSPDGRRVEAITDADLQQVVWVMAHGEEPWGMQTIDARNRLIAVHDLVGLPAD